jgi:hypothetical protein
MYSRFVLAAIGSLMVFFMSPPLLAASCLIAFEDHAKGAVILSHGKEQALTASTLLPDCSQLTLVRGIIHVLYETQEGLTRKTCKDPNAPCRVEAGTSPSWLDPAQRQSSWGGKKMDKDVSRLPGIPHGKVFSVESASTFNFAKAGFAQWNLTVIDADRKMPIFRKSGTDPVVRIPGNLLRSGGKYTWTIDGAKQRYSGGFDILGGREAQDVAKQVSQASKEKSVTARAKKLDELILFYDNNLDYEVELLRDELKL